MTTMTDVKTPAATTSTDLLGPGAILRAESVALLAALVIAYAHLGGSWILFAALLLAPDLSMLGYLVGPRAGAAIYNAVHGYTGPVLAALGAQLVGSHLGLEVALIWAAHISLDRVCGYGLKYPTSFKSTHLARLSDA